jgi:hypothetical protein
MKYYSSTGRRNHGRNLKRLLDTWDRDGSTSGPTPWKIMMVMVIRWNTDTVFLNPWETSHWWDMEDRLQKENSLQLIRKNKTVWKWETLILSQQNCALWSNKWEWYYLLQMSRPALGPTQPTIQWVQWLFPRVNRPEREAAHLSPPSTEVKNEWSYTSSPLTCLHSEDRNKFTFN